MSYKCRNDSEKCGEKVTISGKLKFILKEIDNSMLFYKTIIDEELYKKLVILKNYEKRLNCQLDCCISDVIDSNAYYLTYLNAKEIEDIYNQIVATSEKFQRSSGPKCLNQKELHEFKSKISKSAIQSHPYYIDASFLIINHLSKKCKNDCRDERINSFQPFYGESSGFLKSTLHKNPSMQSLTDRHISEKVQTHNEKLKGSYSTFDLYNLKADSTNRYTKSTHSTGSVLVYPPKNTFEIISTEPSLCRRFEYLNIIAFLKFKIEI